MDILASVAKRKARSTGGQRQSRGGGSFKNSFEKLALISLPTYHYFIKEIEKKMRDAEELSKLRELNGEEAEQFQQHQEEKPEVVEKTLNQKQPEPVQRAVKEAISGQVSDAAQKQQFQENRMDEELSDRDFRNPPISRPYLNHRLESDDDDHLKRPLVDELNPSGFKIIRKRKWSSEDSDDDHVEKAKHLRKEHSVPPSSASTYEESSDKSKEIKPSKMDVSPTVSNVIRTLKRKSPFEESDDEHKDTKRPRIDSSNVVSNIATSPSINENPDLKNSRVNNLPQVEGVKVGQKRKFISENSDDDNIDEAKRPRIDNFPPVDPTDAAHELNFETKETKQPAVKVASPISSVKVQRKRKFPSDPIDDKLEDAKRPRFDLREPPPLKKRVSTYCEYCGSYFSSGSALRRHQRTQHAELLPKVNESRERSCSRSPPPTKNDLSSSSKRPSRRTKDKARAMDGRWY